MSVHKEFLPISLLSVLIACQRNDMPSINDGIVSIDNLTAEGTVLPYSEPNTQNIHPESNSDETDSNPTNALPSNSTQSIDPCDVDMAFLLPHSQDFYRKDDLVTREFQLPPRCASFGGYNLHGGVQVSARNRKGLEALFRYIARPPLAKSRLVSDGEGEYRILLKTPWSDGTSSIQVGLLELMVTERSGVGESLNEEKNRMKTGGYYSATTYPSGVVLWCVCEQCEVSKGDSAEIQACSRTIDVEEAVEERGEEESTQSLGRITVAKLWCHGMGMYALWKDDAITGSCDLSTSDHEDFTWFGCESTWTWFYGTTMIFLGET